MPNQIYEVGPVDTPYQYTVAGAGSVLPRDFQAEYDGSGAGGDYIPAVVIRSQAGHVIARAILQQTITAGDDAEVSWFRGVKAGGGLPTVTIFQATLYTTIHAPGTLQPQQTIPSGVVTPLAWQGIFHAGGGAPGGVVTPSSGDKTITWQVSGIDLTTLSVVWPAGAYDRYIELTVAHPSEIGTVVSPRLRTGLSPAGDTMTLTAAINGTVGVTTTTLTANVFQASGSDKAVSAEMYMGGTSPEVDLS